MSQLGPINTKMNSLETVTVENKYTNQVSQKIFSYKVYQQYIGCFKKLHAVKS